MDIILAQNSQKRVNFYSDSDEDSLETSPSTAKSSNPTTFNLQQYMNEVKSVPLLSHQETIGLFQDLEEKQRKLEETKRQMRACDRPDDRSCVLEQEISDIKETLVTSNLRLVVYLANRYQGRGVPIQDLVQEGNIGLMRAIEKFDYTLGYRFSTYSTWWIRQGMLRAIHQQGRLIRIPTHMLERFQRHLKKTDDAQAQEELVELEEKEDLARPHGEEDPEMVSLMEIMRDPLSLDAPMTDDGLDLQEVTRDEQQMAPEDRVIDLDLREKLRIALATLSLREEIILRLRYGIDLSSSHTLEEVGHLFSLTKERIRQIEARALKRLHQTHGSA